MSTQVQTFPIHSLPGGGRPRPTRAKCPSAVVAGAASAVGGRTTPMGANATPNRAVTLGHVAQNFAPAMSPSPVEFSSVYDSYRVRIFSQCLYMMRNRGDAEDAAQEVYLQLYKKVHTFRGESKFSTWLHRLTTNCVLMEMRKKRRRWHETNPDDVPMAMHDGDESPDGALDHFPAKGTPFFESVNISTAVSQLPVGFQRIFRLHDVEGYTHSEIADQLKIQIGTSKSQLHKARLRLRRLLQNSRVSTEIH